MKLTVMNRVTKTPEVYIVWAEGSSYDGPEPFVIGVALSKEAAKAMIKEADEAMEGSLDCHYEVVGANSLGLNNTIRTFTNDGEKCSEEPENGRQLFRSANIVLDNRYKDMELDITGLV